MLWYPVTPCLLILCSTFLILSCIADAPLPSCAALFFLGLSVPVYYLKQRCVAEVAQQDQIQMPAARNRSGSLAAIPIATAEAFDPERSDSERTRSGSVIRMEQARRLVLAKDEEPAWDPDVIFDPQKSESERNRSGSLIRMEHARMLVLAQDEELERGTLFDPASSESERNRSGSVVRMEQARMAVLAQDGEVAEEPGSLFDPENSESERNRSGSVHRMEQARRMYLEQSNDNL